jgi:hypothetical protein
MSPQSGAASGATAEPPSATTRASVAPLDARIRSVHHAAAARAIASCGVRRDDAIWITECAWCNRVRSTAGEWRTLIEAVRGAIDGARTHGICPACAHACITRAG